MAVILILILGLAMGAWEPGTDPLGNRRHGNWLSVALLDLTVSHIRLVTNISTEYPTPSPGKF